MAATSWNPVSWQPNEVITDEKMQQLSDNVQYLKDNTPRAVYATDDGMKRANGVVIIGGITLITPRQADNAMVRVNFGSTFASGCNPIITTGMINNFQTQVFTRLTGIGRARPDHTGFEAHVKVLAEKDKNDKISNNIYIHYTALGYK